MAKIPVASQPQTDAQTWASLLHTAHMRYAQERAVLSKTGWMSYDDVYTGATRVAAWLHRFGLPKGARVILALDNRPEVVVIERALALWGWIRVAVSARLHAREIEYIAADCQASVVVCEARIADDLQADALVISAEPGVAASVSVSDLFQDQGEPPPPPEISPDDVMSLMYTSGTTGRPKGAINTHRSWHAMATNLLAILPSVEPGDVLLHAAPMSHFSGSVSSAYMVSGAAIATLSRFSPKAMVHEAIRVGATCIPLVPTMLNDLVQAYKGQSETCLPGLRVLPYGGSSISVSTLISARKLLGDVLLQMYGSSEALVPVTSLSIEDHASGTDEIGRLGTAGTPFPGIQVRLENQIDGVGEICIRGANVMAGYWGRPQTTSEVLSAQGWYASGDLGILDESGRVRIVDRKRDVVISGGFNVYPAEVERVIAGLAEVAEVAVIGTAHPRWGESVKALIVLKPGARVTAEEVSAVCLTQLASYKKPLSVEFVAALPKTSTGKVDKRSLREADKRGKQVFQTPTDEA